MTNEERSDPRLEEFKRRTGFDVLEKKASTSGDVNANWLEVQKLPFLSENGWKLVSENTGFGPPGSVGREWTVQKGGAQITVHVFVSSTGVELVRQNLLTRVALTQPITIPYHKSPVPLGEYAVVSPSPKEPMDVIWIYRNVCLQIIGSTGGLPTLELAREYDRFIQAATVNTLDQYRPHLKNVRVAVGRPQVGDTVTITAEMAGEKEKDYIYDFDAPKDFLDYLGEKGAAAWFQALQAGKISVLVKVADRQTLLSNVKSIGIEIVSRK